MVVSIKLLLLLPQTFGENYLIVFKRVVQPINFAMYSLSYLFPIDTHFGLLYFRGCGEGKVCLKLFMSALAFDGKKNLGFMGDSVVL